MGSLGYNVPLHRTLAFGLAAFFASLAGILYVWWNGQIDPATVGLQGTIDLLVIAVIGSRGSRAWLGASPSSLSRSTARRLVPVLGGSFNTIIGFIFLAIVIVSPDGLMGVWDKLTRRARPRRFGRAASEPARSRRRLTLDLESQTSEGHPGFEDWPRIAKGGVPVKHKIQGPGRLIVLLLLVAAVALVGAACGGDDDDKAPLPHPPERARTEPRPAERSRSRS